MPESCCMHTHKHTQTHRHTHARIHTRAHTQYTHRWDQLPEHNSQPQQNGHSPHQVRELQQPHLSQHCPPAAGGDAPLQGGVQIDSMQHESMQHGSVQHGSVQQGKSAHGSTYGSSSGCAGVPHSSVQQDSVQQDAVQKDSVQKDVMQKDSVQKDALQKDAVQTGSLQQDSVQQDPLSHQGPLLTPEPAKKPKKGGLVINLKRPPPSPSPPIRSTAAAVAAAAAASNDPGGSQIAEAVGGHSKSVPYPLSPAHAATHAALAAAVSTDTLASMSDTHPAATQSEVPPIQRQPGIWCGSYCVCVCVCVHLLGQGLVRVEGRASLCVGLCMVICGAVG